MTSQVGGCAGAGSPATTTNPCVDPRPWLEAGVVAGVVVVVVEMTSVSFPSTARVGATSFI